MKFKLTYNDNFWILVFNDFLTKFHYFLSALLKGYINTILKNLKILLIDEFIK